MRNGIITEMFNSYKGESASDAIAGQKVADKLEELLNAGKISTSDLSLGQIAKETIPNFERLRGAEASEVALAVSSSQFPTISKVAINKEIIDQYTLYSENVDQLVSEMEASRTDIEFIAGFTDPEAPELRLEGMSYQETNFGEKDVQVVMADFGRMISVTREAIFNDKTGQLLDQARMIGQLGGQHRAKMVIQTLEVLPRTAFKEVASKAFVYKGTAYANTDFYSADHAALDGRTNKNLVTSNALADYTNVEAAFNAFSAMVSPSGAELAVVPQIIVVHETKAATAFRVFNNDNFAMVGQGANVAPVVAHTTNPFGPNGIKKFQIYTSRYLSVATTWYMGDPKRQLKWLWVYKPATASLASSSEKAFTNNIVMTYKFSYHGGCGHNDYTYMLKNTA
ncbi:MAG TPA: hypothetical protein VI815_03005 [Candidatus Nanoarchaeia archaeon]|nr:hypothetical protein [Candidatus Nanoarchaeia archaeon]